MRVARDFGTFLPQPEQFWLVFFGFVLTNSRPTPVALYPEGHKYESNSKKVDQPASDIDLLR
jgi:hypothetical protein